jgi:hypothetical protein
MLMGNCSWPDGRDMVVFVRYPTEESPGSMDELPGNAWE